jgi:hypothetical protein
MNVTLQPVTQSTLRRVQKLSVSLAQALFHPQGRYRAICLDEVILSLPL